MPAFTGPLDIRSSLITETIVSCGHICTLSSPTVLCNSDRSYGPDRCSASLCRCLRQKITQTVLAGADRLSRSSLITATIASRGHICTLSSPTGLWYSDRHSGEIGAPPSFTGALDRPDRCLQAFQVLTYHKDNCVMCTNLYSQQSYWSLVLRQALQTR